MGITIPSKILQCNCKHEDQDKMHGLHRRVHNPKEGKISGDKKSTDYTCTVCGSIKASIKI